MEGYCTVADVRLALRDADLPGDAAQDRDIAIKAITGLSRWVRETTDSHYFVSGGVSNDSDDLVPTSVRSRSDEEQDIPSTPHPQHSTLFDADRGRYPHRTHGPFCRVALDKRDVSTLETLKIRDASGDFTDWVAASDKTADEDYELYVDSGTTPSRSYINLRANSLPPIQHFDGAVRAGYTYGVDELPDAVRRATAMKAAAELIVHDETNLSIPDQGQLQPVESKARALERQAEEKLDEFA